MDQERKETLSKLLRLEKQRDFLRDRRKQMADRGLKYLDELDALEEKERLEKERVEKEKEQSGFAPVEASSSVLDNFDPSSFLSPSDPFWVDPGIVDGMPSTSQGS